MTEVVRGVDAGEIDPALIEIDPGTGQAGCADAQRCRWYATQMREVLVGRYVGEGGPFPGQIVAAWIDLRGFDYARYCRGVRADAMRQARKAERAGYGCRLFDPREEIPGIVAVNLSLDQRCGKPMTEPYRRGVAEMRRDAETAVEFQPPVCARHYDLWWGVFAPPTQGAEGPFLVGYIRLRRNGNYALVAQLLGHGDHLAHGIMSLLHIRVMAWIGERVAAETQGLEHLIYAGYYSGRSGLQLWKKRFGYMPAYLVVSPGARA